MSKSPFVALLLLLFSLPAVAQTTSYSLDNFDFRNGVRVSEPAPVTNIPTPKSGRTRGNRKSPIVNQVNSEVASMTPTLSSPLIQPTVRANTAGTDVSAMRGFTTGNSQVDGFLVESGKSNGIDPLLLYSVMHQESSFKSHAVSPKGARGLMQLMPGTAVRFGVSNIFDPRQNIEGGARYLRFLSDRFNGEISLILAGYNAGEGAVEKYGWRIPPYAETQEYVRRISRRYSLIQDPNSAMYARPVSSRQLAGLQTKEPAPLSLYERTVSTIRLPDGRLQLMSQ
jgi:hypothetical protein